MPFILPNKVSAGDLITASLQNLIIDDLDWLYQQSNNSVKIDGEEALKRSLIPDNDDTYYLGHSDFRWKKLFVNGIDMNGNKIENLGQPTAPTDAVRLMDIINVSSVSQDILPDIDALRSLGSTTKRWKNIYSAGDLGYHDGTDIVTGIPSTNPRTFRIGHDLLMARTGDGDYAWKRALVPRSSTKLSINYAGDFSDGVEFGSKIFPSTNNAYDIGTSSYKFKDLYLGGKADIGSLNIGGTEVISSARNLVGLNAVSQSLTPATDNQYNLGSTSIRWKFLYLVSLYLDYLYKFNSASGDNFIQVVPPNDGYRQWLRFRRGGTTATESGIVFSNYDSLQYWLFNDGTALKLGTSTTLNFADITTLMRITSANINLHAPLLPDATNTRDLGSSSYRFRTLYAYDIDLSSRLSTSSSQITPMVSIIPNSDNSKNLGSSTYKFRTIYAYDIDLYNRLSTSSSQITPKLNIIPDTNNTIDIGSSTYKFKDLYLAGTLNGNQVTCSNITANRLTLNNHCLFCARRTTSQSINSAQTTKVQLNVEDFDTDNCFDNATNYRFTAPVNGYYHFDAGARVSFTVDQKYLRLFLMKNGTTFIRSEIPSSGSNYVTCTLSIDMNLVTNDYIEIYVEHNAGTAQSLIEAWLSGHLISTA